VAPFLRNSIESFDRYSWRNPSKSKILTCRSKNTKECFASIIFNIRVQIEISIGIPWRYVVINERRLFPCCLRILSSYSSRETFRKTHEQIDNSMCLLQIDQRFTKKTENDHSLNEKLSNTLMDWMCSFYCQWSISSNVIDQSQMRNIPFELDWWKVEQTRFYSRWMVIDRFCRDLNASLRWQHIIIIINYEINRFSIVKLNQNSEIETLYDWQLNTSSNVMLFDKRSRMFSIGIACIVDFRTSIDSHP
jgi:hypothetical protein